MTPLQYFRLMLWAGVPKGEAQALAGMLLTPVLTRGEWL